MKRVRARAPLRLGLAGGGTDVPEYSEKFGGQVLNASIDMCVYTTAIVRDDGLVEFGSSDGARAWQSEAKWPLKAPEEFRLHAAVYNRFVSDYCGGEPLAITLVTHSDAPNGSGLGASSTIVVSLVGALVELLAVPLGEYDIAALAYQIERVDAGLSGGMQDQYAAAFGGFNFMEFSREGRVIVNPLRIRAATVAELEASLVLFFTGRSRASAQIIDDQKDAVRRADAAAIDGLHGVRREAQTMKEALLRNDLPAMAASLRDGWHHKKLTARSVSNPAIDAVYEAAMASGAVAGKVSGAGGGGFMMFMVDPIRRGDVLRALAAHEGQVFGFRFSTNGVESWTF